ncbi:MAG: tetraacyldisaccharide 4'-kinase [Bryobacteraceae bacterium]
MKIKGIYLLYRILQAFGWPAVLLYLVVRSIRNPGYFRSLGQRHGFLPASFKQTIPGSIWLHAVSVGEVTAALELIRELRARLPRSPVFVSVSTLAGYETGCQKLQDQATVFYAPLDYVWAVRRVLRTLRPAVVIVLETEIWPNLFREVWRTGARLLHVNGRISDRAQNRYLSMRWFFSAVLPHADLILVQGEQMRQRFVRTGAPPETVRIGGNLKYDFKLREAPPDSPVRRFIDRVKPDAVWIAASTMPPAKPDDPDEVQAVIDAFKALSARKPGLLLLLAPRRPNLFEEDAAKLRRSGVSMVRRSELRDMDSVPLPGVLLLDSIGELSGLFGLADVVFMGGTLVSRGGHNILEPAMAARPIVVGPHMENFTEIADDFRAAGALVEVQTPSELADAVSRVLDDRAFAEDLSSRAQSRARAKQGVATAAAEEICRQFAQGVPAYRPAQPAFAILWMLSRIWLAGAGRNRRRDLTRRRTLRIPVISIGNITAGGTGKTPMVLFTAARLKNTGWKPGILTRGYGRQSPHKHEALPAGGSLPPERSGDEPQIFLRSGVAPVGIGPDRFSLGHLLQRDFGVNVLVLDDGFQHVRLDRRIDVVLIDSLNPFGGGYPLPLGRLREPLGGLSRADLFVVTRSNFGRMESAIESCLRHFNPNAPIFRSRVRPLAWVSHESGGTLPLDSPPFSKVAAFCGLGNPDSFWYTLSELGLDVVDRVAYGDHHAYQVREIRFMATQFQAAGAQAVVTTEKDSFNLCEDAARLLAPLPLYWLKAGAQLEREAEFLQAISDRLVSGVPTPRS